MALTGVTNPTIHWIERAAVLAGVALVAIGLLCTPVFAQLSSAPVWHNLEFACIALALAWVVSRLSKQRLATGMAFIAALLLFRFVGLEVIAASMLTLCAAIVVGSKLQRASNPLSFTTSALCGIALLTGITGWLLPFEIHYFLAYLVVLLGVVYLGRKRLGRVFRSSFVQWNAAISAAPVHASIAMLVVVVASASLLIPSVLFDDLSYHLLLPTQLATLSRYKLDVASQIWAAAPWASDVLQGYIAILSGRVERGGADALWFLLTLTGLWQLGRELGLKAGLRWLSLGLYASVPLVSALNVGMQADSAIAAASVALAALAAKGIRTRNKAAIVPFVVVSGLLMALKTTQALLILPLTLVLIAVFGAKSFMRVATPKLPLALLACGSSYAYAWLITRNPIFPLFNGIFRSAFALPVNFDDTRWHQGLHWDSVWDVTFYTNKYQEAYPGALGFALVALAACILVALMRPRLRWLVASLLFSLIALFSGIQYVRYVVPILAPLMSVALVVWQRANLRYLGDLLLVGVISINVIFIPSSFYLFNGDISWLILSEINQEPISVRETVQRDYAPEFLVEKYLKLHYQGRYFIYLADSNRPFLGPFGGNAVTASWYDLGMQTAVSRIDKDASGLQWIGLFERTGIDHVLTSGEPSGALGNALSRMHAIPELTLGNTRLWSLCGDNCGSSTYPLLDVRDTSKRISALF